MDAAPETAPALAFTCNTCNVTFNDEASQRSHHRLDWHRYNLKRKVASLPGVTESWFEKRREALAAERAVEQRMQYKCTLCGKTYASRKAHEQHLTSRAHLLKAAAASPTKAALGTVIKPAAVRPDSAAETAPAAAAPKEDSDSDDEWEEVGAEDELADADEGGPGGNDSTPMDEDADVVPWDSRRCLFCQLQTDEVEGCISHMHKEHGFFIPDAEYLTDPEGLLQYLGFKVTVGLECLHCSKQFRSLEAVRKHMTDKSHCKLPTDTGEGDEEIEEFYDFSSSYPETSGDAAQSQALATSDSLPPVSLARDGFELVVRSTDAKGGIATKALGARELARFYKQRVRTIESRPEVLAAAIAARYRSLGLATRPAWVMRPGGKRADSAAVWAKVYEAHRTRVGYTHNKTWNTHNNDPSGR